jgi:hypothetical protein
VRDWSKKERSTAGRRRYACTWGEIGWYWWRAECRGERHVPVMTVGETVGRHELVDKPTPGTGIIDEHEGEVDGHDDCIPHIVSWQIPDDKVLRRTVITVVSEDHGSSYSGDHGMYQNSWT